MGTAEKLFIGESGQRQSKIGVDHGRDYALFLPSWARNLITAEEPRFPHPHLHRRSSAEVRCGATAVPREHPPTSDRQGGPKAAVAATNRATRSSERRRRFAAALAASQIQYEPDWYDGSHPWNRPTPPISARIWAAASLRRLPPPRRRLPPPRRRRARAAVGPAVAAATAAVVTGVAAAAARDGNVAGATPEYTTGIRRRANPRIAASACATAAGGLRPSPPARSDRKRFLAARA